jgi:hypothetical protein
MRIKAEDPGNQPFPDHRPKHQCPSQYAPDHAAFINKAGVDRKALQQGLKFAAMILRSTGVELLTVDCSLDASQAAPPCSGFTGPSQISIRLIRRPQKGAGEIGCQKLGFADQLDTTPGSGVVYLFGDRIETAARDQRVPLQDVLGVVITHEIGHLLIAPGHADRGIMRSQLEAGEWRKASQGMLGFTPRQAEIIREGVLSETGPRKPNVRAGNLPPQQRGTSHERSLLRPNPAVSPVGHPVSHICGAELRQRAGGSRAPVAAASCRPDLSAP